MIFYTSNNEFYFTSIKISSFDFTMSVSGCSCFLNGVEYQGTFSVSIGDRYFFTSTNPANASITIDGVTQSVSTVQSVTIFDVSKLIRLLKEFFLEFPITDQLYTNIIISSDSGFISLSSIDDIILSFESKFDRILSVLNQWISDLAFSSSSLSISYRDVADILKSLAITVDIYPEDLQDTKSIYDDPVLNEFQYYPTIIKLESLVREFITDSELLDIARDLYNVIWLQEGETYTPTSLMSSADVAWVQQRMVDLGIVIQQPASVDLQDTYVKKIDLLTYTNDSLVSIVQGLLKRLTDRIEYSSSVLIEDLSVDNQVSVSVVDIDPQSEYQVSLLVEIIKLDNPSFVAMATDGFESILSSLTEIAPTNSVVVENVKYTQITDTNKPIPLEYSDVVVATSTETPSPTETTEQSQSPLDGTTALADSGYSGIAQSETSTQSDTLNVEGAVASITSVEGVSGTQPSGTIEYAPTNEALSEQPTQTVDVLAITNQTDLVIQNTTSQESLNSADTQSNSTTDIAQASVDSVDSTTTNSDSELGGSTITENTTTTSTDTANPTSSDGFTAISKITETSSSPQSTEQAGTIEQADSTEIGSVPAVELTSSSDLTVIDFIEMELDSAVIEVEYKDVVSLIEQAEIDSARVERSTVEILTDVEYDDFWGVVETREATTLSDELLEVQVLDDDVFDVPAEEPISDEALPPLTITEIESIIDYQNISVESLIRIEEYLIGLLDEANIPTTTLSILNQASSIEERLIQIQLASSLLVDSGIQNNPIVEIIQSAFQSIFVASSPLSSLVLSEALVRQIISDSGMLYNLYSAVLFDTSTQSFGVVDAISDVQQQLTSYLVASVVGSLESGQYNINLDAFALLRDLYSTSTLTEALTVVAQQNVETAIAVEKFLAIVLANDFTSLPTLTVQDINAISRMLASLGSELIESYQLRGNFESPEQTTTPFLESLAISFAQLSAQRLTSYLTIEVANVSDVINQIVANFAQYLREDSQSDIDTQTQFIEFIRIASQDGILFGVPVSQESIASFPISTQSTATLREVFGDIASQEEEAILAEIYQSTANEQELIALLDPNQSIVDYNITAIVANQMNNIISDIVYDLASVLIQVGSDTIASNDVVDVSLEATLDNRPEIVVLLTTTILSNIIQADLSDSSITVQPVIQRNEIETLIANIEQANPIIASLVNSSTMDPALVEAIISRLGAAPYIDASIQPIAISADLVINVQEIDSVVVDVDDQVMGVVVLPEIVPEVVSEIVASSEVMVFTPFDINTAFPVKLESAPLPNPTREEFELILLWLRRRLIQEQITIAPAGSRPAFERVAEYEFPLALLPLIGLSILPTVIKIDAEVKAKTAMIVTKLSSAEIEVASNIIKQQIASAKIQELKSLVSELETDVVSVTSELGTIDAQIQTIQTILESSDPLLTTSVTQKFDSVLAELASSNAIQSLSDPSEIAPLSNKLGELESTLIAIQAILDSIDVFDLAKTTTISELAITVTEIKSTIDELALGIAILTNKIQETAPVIDLAVVTIQGEVGTSITTTTPIIQETDTSPIEPITQIVDEVNQSILVANKEQQELQNTIQVTETVLNVTDTQIEELSNLLGEVSTGIQELETLKEGVVIGIEEVSVILGDIQSTVQTITQTKDFESIDVAVKYNDLSSVDVGVEEKTITLEQAKVTLVELINSVDLSDPSSVEAISSVLGEVDTLISTITANIGSVDTGIEEKSASIQEQELTVLELIKTVQEVEGTILEYKNNTDVSLTAGVYELITTIATVQAKILEVVKILAEIKLSIYVKQNLVEFVKMADFPKKSSSSSDDEFDLVYLSWMPKSRRLMYGDDWEKYSVAPFSVDYYFIDRFRELYMFITPGNTYEDEMAYLAHIIKLYGAYIKGAVF
jgi:hypothetical protein